MVVISISFLVGHYVLHVRIARTNVSILVEYLKELKLFEGQTGNMEQEMVRIIMEILIFEVMKWRVLELVYMCDYDL